uniref:Uncharacterized protein n=1 Tax=viral metagenome TaxID=1070528 RepID=A0A6C0JID8_9ZZZZ
MPGQIQNDNKDIGFVIALFFPILIIISGFSFVSMVSLDNSNVIKTFISLILFWLSLVIILVFLLISNNKLDHKDLDPKNTNFMKNLVNSIGQDEPSKIGFIVMTTLIVFVFLVSRIWYARQSGVQAPTLSSIPPLSAIPAMIFSLITSLFSTLNQLFVDFFKNITKELTSSEEMQGAFIRYAGLYGFIFMVGVILYIASTDPAALTTKAYVYTFSIIIPLVLLIGFVVPFSTTQRSATSTFLLIGVIMAVMTAIFYAYSSMNAQTYAAVSYILNFIMIIIVLIGLAIFFYIFSNYLKSIEGFVGFFIYFLFYIPCLIIDFANYILNEFKMTSRPVYFLFVIEIILILLYIYLPKLIKLANQSSNVTVLLADSAFLDDHQVIGNSNQLKMTNQTTSIDKSSGYLNISTNNLSTNKTFEYRRTYAISMWTYLNIQPPNNISYSQETQIFNYGNGKPKITYFNNTSTDKSKDKYTIYFSNNKIAPNTYELTLPSQKWNNIVFNYYSDKADLFINGNLERTFKYVDNMPIYLATDVVEIGSKNGLDGAISNIRYYNNPLTKTQITSTYNLLVNKNPPTFET